MLKEHILNKTLNNIFLSSILSGLIFWFVIFSPYLVKAILSGIMPFDAISMLILFLIFSFSAGTLIFLPSYNFLAARLKTDKDIISVSLATFISIVYVMTITGKIYDEVFYMAAVLAGYFGGKLFHFLHTRS